MSCMHFVNYRVCTKLSKRQMTTSELVYFYPSVLTPWRDQKVQNKLFKNDMKKITISFIHGERSCSYSWIITVPLQQMEKQSQGWGGSLEEWLGTRPRMSMFNCSGQTVEGCPDWIVNAMERSGRLINDLRSSNGNFFCKKDKIRNFFHQEKPSERNVPRQRMGLMKGEERNEKKRGEEEATAKVCCLADTELKFNTAASCI